MKPADFFQSIVSAPKNNRMTHPLILFGLILSSAIISILQPLSASSQPKELTEVTFFCRDVYDPTSNLAIPVTYAWVPERKGNIAIIGWKSEFFSKYSNPSDRCKEATQKFQDAYQNKRLNYLSAGTVDGYPVICGLSESNESCTPNNQLFKLKPHDRPQNILRQLVDVLEGNTSNMLSQSNTASYLSLTQLFKTGTLAKDRTPPECSTEGRDAPCKSKSGGSEVRDSIPKPISP
jgi:hypothetical protein